MAEILFSLFMDCLQFIAAIDDILAQLCFKKI